MFLCRKIEWDSSKTTPSGVFANSKGNGLVPVTFRKQGLNNRTRLMKFTPIDTETRTHTRGRLREQQNHAPKACGYARNKSVRDSVSGLQGQTQVYSDELTLMDGRVWETTHDCRVHITQAYKNTLREGSMTGKGSLNILRFIYISI